MIPMVYYAGPSASPPPDIPGTPGDPPRRGSGVLGLLTRIGVLVALLMS